MIFRFADIVTSGTFSEGYFCSGGLYSMQQMSGNVNEKVSCRLKPLSFSRLFAGSGQSFGGG